MTHDRSMTKPRDGRLRGDDVTIDCSEAENEDLWCEVGNEARVGVAAVAIGCQQVEVVRKMQSRTVEELKSYR